MERDLSQPFSTLGGSQQGLPGVGPKPRAQQGLTEDQRWLLGYMPCSWLSAWPEHQSTHGSFCRCWNRGEKRGKPSVLFGFPLLEFF